MPTGAWRPTPAAKVSSLPPSRRSRIQRGGLLMWWLGLYGFELQARGHSAGPASQRGQQQGLARKSLPPPMPGVCRLKGGQLASALVRPRRLREPGATPTQGVRAVPGGARKGIWVVTELGQQPLIGAPVSGSCWTAYAPKVCNHLLFGQCCTLGYRNNAVFA